MRPEVIGWKHVYEIKLLKIKLINPIEKYF